MHKFLVVCLAGVAVLSGCAASPKMGNIIPQSGGKYQVITSGPSRDEALKSALFSAESTCKERNMRHIVSAQSTSYKGVVSEDANKTMDRAASLVAAVTGTWIPTLSDDEDYQMTLGFSCEN
ncbi:hypothetical protein [Rhodoferax sp.]|uniref:hypothetical protein n=1 Tax=Rhodoferax sp. TaxID=50421 RepID=UPI00271C9396|nr:hypothetical protein [Rhodoferax sp.]MDO9144635.1 hypothetical protein [Rhodoferax sp.]